MRDFLNLQNDDCLSILWWASAFLLLQPELMEWASAVSRAPSSMHSISIAATFWKWCHMSSICLQVCTNLPLMLALCWTNFSRSFPTFLMLESDYALPPCLRELTIQKDDGPIIITLQLVFILLLGNCKNLTSNTNIYIVLSCICKLWDALQRKRVSVQLHGNRKNSMSNNNSYIALSRTCKRWDALQKIKTSVQLLGNCKNLTSNSNSYTTLSCTCNLWNTLQEMPLYGYLTTQRPSLPIWI